jgi:hypothetical protein
MPAILCQKVVFSAIKENLANNAIKRKITSGLVIVKPKEVRKSCTWFFFSKLNLVSFFTGLLRYVYNPKRKTMMLPII